MLSELKSLTETHYSWFQHDVIKNDPERAFELARIFGSLSLRPDDITQEIMDATVKILAKTKGKIGFNYSPVHRRWPKGQPPTLTGYVEKYVLTYYQHIATKFLLYLEKANRKYDADIQVGLVMLDSEVFYTKAGEDEYNEAIRVKLDMFHDATKAMFPDVDIVWYGRGMNLGNETEWKQSGVFTGQEKTDVLACSLYSIFEPELTLRRIRETLKLGDTLGVQDMAVYISLGAGYERDLAKWSVWRDELDWNVWYSWQMGLRLNNPWCAKYPDRFIDNSRIRYRIFFIPAESKYFDKHLTAYVNGSHLIKEF